MTHLPRNQADEVATKGDIARLEGRFDQMQRTLVVSIVGSMTALTAIFSLVVSFLD